MDKPNILVVEDEFIVAHDIKNGLEEMQYTVCKTVTSGEEAIQSAEKYRPDLVLMDIILRGQMDGIQAAEQIRRRFSIPVIFTTAHVDDPLLERAKATEPFGYLLKPFTHKELQSAIEIGLYKAQMEAKLQKREQRFKLLAENARDIIYLYRLTPRPEFEYISPSVTEISGFAPQEFYDNPDLIWKIMHPDDLPVFNGTLRPKYNFDKPINLRWIRKDRVTIWTELRNTPIYDEAGQVIAVEGIMRDISRQKKADKAIKASHLFLEITNRHTKLKPMLDEFIREIKNFTGCMAAGIRILNHQREVFFQEFNGFNKEFHQSECASSMPAAKCICMKILMGEPPSTSACCTEARSFYINAGEQFRENAGKGEMGPTTLLCNDLGYESVALIPVRSGERMLGLIHVADTRKEMIPLETIRLLEDTGMQLGTAVQRVRAEAELKKSHLQLEKTVEERTGRLSEANIILKAEINERQLMQAKLLQSKAMLQGVFDGIADPLILVDSNMAVKMLNSTAAERYKIDDRKYAVGRSFYEVTGDHKPSKDCIIQKAVSGNQKTSLERKTPTASERLERVFIYPVKENRKKAGDAIIHVIDITEERRIENQLIQSEKMASLGVLVSSIAHEINNPNSFVTFNVPILKDYLNAIIPFADEFAQKHPDIELFNMSYAEFRKDLFKLVANIEHGSGRISSFVSNLREFSQSNGRKSKKWVELNSIIDKVLSICYGKIKKTVKSFNLLIPDNFPSIFTDPHTLEQVLLNLLVNASQAADKKDSWLTVSASSGYNSQDHTIIEISDNGSGMDEETIKHIFDPFFTTKSQADGTGLGLYVCHNLVEILGGRIEVDSEPGKGSTFRVYLPAKDTELRPRI